MIENAHEPDEVELLVRLRDVVHAHLAECHGVLQADLRRRPPRMASDDDVVDVHQDRNQDADIDEVRALAASYGDPNEVLYEVWRPDVPGVNSPGSYEDYAKDPWKYKLKMWDGIDNGTYPYIDKRTTKPAQKTP